MKRIIYTVVAAAAVLTGSVAAAAPALAGNGPGQSISAYYWQPNGHALGGPQAGPANFSSGNLALMAQNMHGQNINGLTITVTGTLDRSVVQNSYSGDVGSYARVWFDGAGGSSAQSPQGYLGQVWWAHGSNAVLDLNSNSGGPGPVGFILTMKVDASQSGNWSDWNGKDAYDNQALFQQAASHVQQMGLSFGGSSFFEDGDAGTGGITVTSITAS